jgi:hypothetical protein
MWRLRGPAELTATASKKLREDNAKLRKQLELALGDLRELQPSHSPVR